MKILVDILVVDDEKSICETLKWTLELEGFKVTCVMDFNIAEEVIRTSNFDVYIIDLILPGRSGIELIKLIKELKRNGTVMILTGYPDIPSLVDSIRLDTFDYIKKPINQEKLLNIINHALQSKKVS